jgi:ribosomal protein S27AE
VRLKHFAINEKRAICGQWIEEADRLTTKSVEITCTKCRRSYSGYAKKILAEQDALARRDHIQNAVYSNATATPVAATPRVQESGLIPAREVIRALDVILIKANCPNCGDENLISPDTSVFDCPTCHHNTKVDGFDLDGANHRNLVAWAAGNIRRYVGKRIIQELYKMQEGYCAYCSTDISKVEYHVEHIIPISFGGSNKINNLALSCPRCNLIAGAKVFPSYMAKRNYIQSQRLA